MDDICPSISSCTDLETCRHCELALKLRYTHTLYRQIIICDDCEDDIAHCACCIGTMEILDHPRTAIGYDNKLYILAVDEYTVLDTMPVTGFANELEAYRAEFLGDAWHGLRLPAEAFICHECGRDSIECCH